MSYAHCDWSVTMFISSYANTVVTSQHISQSYFIKEIENGCQGFKQIEANTRESLVEFESIVLTLYVNPDSISLNMVVRDPTFQHGYRINRMLKLTFYYHKLHSTTFKTIKLYLFFRRIK